MKKAVLSPDSFKGTISSADICAVMRGEILRLHPDCTVVSVPVADGGEGSVDAFLSALGGKKVSLTLKGPFFEETKSFYGLINRGSTAGTEMAEAYAEGVSAIFTINRLPMPLSESRAFTRENLAFAMENILRLMAT